MGSDPFRVDHGFIGGNIQVEVLLVNAPEGAQLGTKRCPYSFVGIAVDLANAIVIIITCPLPYAVTHRSMGRIVVMVTLPFIHAQACALPRTTLGE
jgi:hypothetical protein